NGEREPADAVIAQVAAQIRRGHQLGQERQREQGEIEPGATHLLTLTDVPGLRIPLAEARKSSVGAGTQGGGRKQGVSTVSTSTADPFRRFRRRAACVGCCP